MLPIYAAALAVGGTLLAASLVLGHHGADHPHDLVHDFADHAGAHGGPDFGVLGAVLSLRFWTFALAFFGLTGIVFEKLVPLSNGRTVLAVSIAMGATVGFAAAWIVNRLRSQVVTSIASEVGYAGLEGEVLLDVTPDEPGRIRISARGSLIDLPARSEGERFAKGARARVVDVTDGVARVAAPRN